MAYASSDRRICAVGQTTRFVRSFKYTGANCLSVEKRMYQMVGICVGITALLHSGFDRLLNTAKQ